MITLPSSLVSLLALLGALLFAGGLFGRARAGQRRLAERLAGLEQRLAEQQAALERSESARSAAEADLRATEQRYLLALRGSQDGLWEWDLGSGAVHLSPRWKSMLGFESHELSDDRPGWHSRVHPQDRDALERALQRHLAGETARFDQELRLLHKDGSQRRVLSRGVAIRDDTGRPYRMVGLDTDVTALRRVQAVLDEVAEGTAGTSGDRFFAAMVQHFAQALEVERAFITECANQPVTRVRTLAYWSASRGARDSFEFDLAGTPCEEVVQQGRVCFHPEKLATLFPREVGYESYVGLPIVASDGRVLGHLAIFDTRPRSSEDLVVDRVYRIFLARAAAEMERLQAVARLAAPAG